ncbi:MAG: peptidase M66, partial [Meiothermus sp.]|nr:peptidase M66 [Meiothermus sp.]
PAGPDIRISQAEWGQTILKENLKLVSGKQALLRVSVVADRSGVSAGLSAQVWRGGAFQGNVALTGPATLPTSVSPGDLSQTFWGTLPASWVGSGLEVRLQADPTNAVAESNEANNSRTLTPSIMTVGTVLYLTSIPIRYTDTGASNTVRTPSIPNFGPFLTDIFPISGVQTTTRAAAYSFSGNLRNGSDWSRLLNELRTLHSTDGRGPDHYYYGFIQTGYSSGIIGIGYINWPVGAGWDRNATSNYSNDSSAWVMAHELGHNFNRWHAPCGATDGLDGAYPYTGAGLGTWGYSFGNTALNLINPNTVFDVMSYCNSQWTSDYTYEAVQRYLENNPPTAARVLMAQTSSTALLVRGSIRGGQVSLEPLMRLQAPVSPPQSGPYRLRLQTASGPREVSFSTSVVAAPHGAGVAFGGAPEEHFSFTLPDAGEVTGLEIARGSLPLFSRQLGLRPMSTDDPGLRLSESGGFAQLYWSPSVFPYAAVAHLGPQRTSLALNLTGGEGRLETSDLPAGGQLEVVLSDGINSRRWVFNR